MEPITNINLKFSCPANWDEMPTVAGGKHCDKCQHKVYDFTSSNQEEYLRILAENNNQLCGRFNAHQMQPGSSSGWKKWISAAMILIGINFFNEAVHAQKKKLKLNPRIKITDTVNASTAFVGVVDEVMPQFPGGDTALVLFLRKNIHYKGTTGKIFAQFTIGKDGKIGDIEILRGLDDATNDEVIRVLKLSPKWKPGEQSGKPIARRYIIPVAIFK